MKTLFKRLKRYVDGAPQSQLPEALTLTDPAVIAGFRDMATDLRAHKPVCPVSGGGVLLLASEDVKLAFSNPALSNEPSRFSALAAKNKDRYVAASIASNILPFLDGPRHIALRKWLSAAFFKQMRSFTPKIEQIARRHRDAVPVGQQNLLVEGIARAYAVDVIGRFIGAPMTPTEMKRYTTSLFRLFAPAADVATFAQTNEGLAEARHHLSGALAQNRTEPADCLLTTLDQSFPPDMDAEEKDQLIVDNALLFLADGVENVEAAIGIAMMAHGPSDPITPDSVRAAIRADTPGQTIARIASQDMTIGDEQVKAGTPVFLSLASANDDPRMGDEFTFGRGRHKCLGETLALLTITSFCQALAEKSPDLDISNLNYRGMFGHKWPRGITITLRA